jgi:predicted PurR-regulated permease PerM
LAAVPEPPPHRHRHTRLMSVDERSLLVLGAVCVAAVVLVDVGTSAWGSLVQVLVAMVLALALDRLVRGVERGLHLPRGAAVAVVVGAAGAAGLAFATVVARALVQQARSGVLDSTFVADQLADAPFVGDALQREDIPARAERWLQTLPEQLGSGAIGVTGTLRVLANMAISTTFVALLVVLLLLEGPRLLAFVRQAIPERQRELAERIGDGLYVAVGRYAAGSVLLAVMAGTAALAIGLALEVPVAIVAGLWALVWNFVPQLGGTVGGAGLVLLAATRSLGTAALALVLWLIYSQVENRVVQPIIIGRAVSLSPLTTMVGALSGAAVAGLVGAVLAVPLIAAAAVVRRELGKRRVLP